MFGQHTSDFILAPEQHMDIYKCSCVFTLTWCVESALFVLWENFVVCFVFVFFFSLLLLCSKNDNSTRCEISYDSRSLIYHGNLFVMIEFYVSTCLKLFYICHTTCMASWNGQSKSNKLTFYQMILVSLLPIFAQFQFSLEFNFSMLDVNLNLFTSPIECYTRCSAAIFTLYIYNWFYIRHRVTSNQIPNEISNNWTRDEIDSWNLWEWNASFAV